MSSSATALTTAELDLAIVRNPLIVSPETTVIAAIAEMSGVRLRCNTTRNPDEHLDDIRIEARSSCVLIVETGRAIGILTERDIVRLSAEGQALEGLTMREVMVHPVITLRESAFKDLFFAINLLGQYGIRHLPVLDDRDCLTGLITHESLRQISRPTDLLRLRRVAEVTTRGVVCAPADASILAIAKQMAEHRVSSVVIVESEGSLKKPIGILTERDLVQFRALNLNLETYRAETVMSAPVFTITPEESLWQVQEIMERHLIRRVVVTGKQGELAGIVTQTSLLQVLNLLELYKVTEFLEAKVERLETERVTLLENRTVELERQVEARTAELERQVKREKLLAELATQIRSSLSLQGILETTVEKIRQVLACDRVSIWQFDEDGCSVIVAESTDSPLSLMGERIRDCCFNTETAEHYRQGRIRIVPDIYTTEMSDCHRELLLRLQTRAKILVPLLCGEKLWGLLNVTEGQHPRDWQPETVELLQALSVQLAIALQQATTHQQLQAELQERQQAEARLRESERRYASLVAAVPVGIFRHDASGRGVYVNDRCCEISGLCPEATRGEGWQDGLHPEDCQKAIAEWERAMREDRPFRLEYRFQRPDGTVKWVYTQSAPERDARGQIIGYVGTMTDISDRKQLELELQASKEQLGDILDNVSVSVTRLRVFADRRWEYDYVSRGCEAIFGYPPETFMENNALWISRICPEDRERIVESIFEAVSSGETRRWEYRLRHRDGSIRWISETLSSRWQEAEQCWIATLAGIDISDRKETEARLRESQQRYASLMAVAPVGIFHTDTEGHCTYVNDRYCQISGLNREMAAGEGWQQGLHPDDRPIIIAEWERSVSENRPFQLEYRFQHPDGTLRWVYGQSVAERNASEEIAGYVGTITDISDRKQAEAQIQEMSQRLALATNAANIGVWDLDLATNRLIWDKRMYELYGIDPTESGAVYETWQRGVHPEDMPSAHAAVQAAIAGERDFHVEFRAVWPDGQIRFIEAHAIVLREEGGDAQRMIGVNWDISDRKQAEGERLQAERVRLELKLLEQLFDIILAGYWDWNIAEGRAYLSPSFKRMFGYEDEELPNTPESWQNSIFPEDLPSVLDCFDRHVRSRGQIPFYNEVRYHHKNGSTVWAICSGQVIEWDEEGRPLRAIGFNMNISDRKQAEEHLQQLSARLNLAVESAAIGIWDWDIARDRLIWDWQMHQLYGIAPNDFAGVYQAWLSLVHPDDLSNAETTVRQALESGLDFDSTFRIVHPDGTIRSIQANALVQYDGRGKPQRMIGINYDITDRQESEQIILQQAEREKLLREITQKIRQSLDLQTIFDTACQEIRTVLQADRVGIFKFYPDSNFNEGEFAAESVAVGLSSVVGVAVRDDCFGTNYAQLYTRGRFLVIDNLDRTHLTPCHADILATFNVLACMVMPLPCGDELWGLLCVHQCTSERHWQQAEIDFTHQLANQIAIAIQQANLYEQLQQELKERQNAQQQLTERNQQLAISNEELARATRLKDEFLANMSHELRTPLNAISGMTEGLQEGIFGEVNAQQIKALQTIKQSGTYLLELINDILDLAKIESGQIVLEIAPTAVAPLCRSSLAFIKQQAMKKRIQVEIDLCVDLPDLLVDERRVRQVLINLLANAVKFTAEGGSVTLKVSDRWIAPSRLSGVTWMQSYRKTLKDHSTLGGEKAIKYLRIAVIDTGIGIAPQHMDKLFQPFVQIDSTLNRQYTGTGLGLALVKRIIELHGGEMGLSSEVGVGSCFTIGLPCAVGTAAVSHSQRPNFSPRKPEGVSSVESPLILLAEDNEANIITVSSYLRAKGFRILAANNGLEAIALARDEHPNVILMDIQMPKMDGLEAIQQIRRDRDLANIPIIALTALAMPGDRDRCLTAGADDYLSKPIKLQQLATVLQHLLASREERS